jgi:NADPH:quinone reductase-like Zn-dependent oxidoreductase
MKTTVATSTGANPTEAHTIRGVVLDAVQRLDVRNVPAPEPAPGEAIVRLRAAALNHRDVWIKQGQYAGLKFPIIPGSDGAGVVSRLGPGVAADWAGKEVIINPGIDWGDDPRAQSGRFSILGLPRDGTLAEEVTVPVSNLHPKPVHLDWPHAAALPLAGLTAYRALFSRAQLRPGEKALITGVGGGVALFALQFAVAHGAQVWITTGSPEKLARAKEIGAQGGANYRDSDWARKLENDAGRFDVIVDSAGGPGFLQLVDLAAPGGRITFFGATAGDPPGLPQRKIFWRQLSLLGSTMGSPGDFAAMLDFVNRRRLTPVLGGSFPLEQAAAAFALMEQGGQFGKIVLTLPGTVP